MTISSSAFDNHHIIKRDFAPEEDDEEMNTSDIDDSEQPRKDMSLRLISKNKL